MKFIIVDDCDLTKDVLVAKHNGSKPTPLSNGQTVVRVDDRVAVATSGYVRYTNDDILRIESDLYEENGDAKDGYMVNSQCENNTIVAERISIFIQNSGLLEGRVFDDIQFQFLNTEQTIVDYYLLGELKFCISVDRWNGLDVDLLIELDTLTIDALNVNSDDPVGTVVGDLSATGGHPAYSYAVDAPYSTYFEVINDNELAVKADISGLTSPYNVDVTVTDSRSLYTAAEDGVLTETFAVAIAGWDNDKKLSFNGVDEAVNISDSASLSITNKLTVAAWVKTTGATSMSMCSKYAAGNMTWFFGVTGGKIWVLTSTNGSAYKDLRSDATINDGNLKLVAFTFDTDTIKININGVDQATTLFGAATVNSLYDSTTDVVIGAANGGAANFWDSFIDEVCIWDTAVLSAAELLALYNGGVPIDPKVDSGNYTSSSDLVSYWTCGDGDTSPTITDNVGSNDGTMQNMDASNIVDV